jgi:quinoprotein dehydrogenase-associated probable ABC transporter substrate-binding protein
VFTFAVSLVVLPIGTQASAQDRALRVCADPNNLPFSNDRLEGFENKVAQLVADEMHATVQYRWHPQRRGFIRETLRAGLCDLVVGVPSGYDLVLSTTPYYRSTYVFVYPKRRNFELRSFDDAVLRPLKIGLEEIGADGANTPPAHALARRGLASNIVGFKLWDVSEVESPPGRIIDAVAAGEIDVAIVWGPFAGYFARRQPAAVLEIVPVSAAVDMPSLPFAYDIAMGVRPGDAALKSELEGILVRRRADIGRILEEYGVPLLDVQPHREKQPEEQ